jgi:hypothetical protein
MQVACTDMAAWWKQPVPPLAAAQVLFGSFPIARCRDPYSVRAVAVFSSAKLFQPALTAS